MKKFFILIPLISFLALLGYFAHGLKKDPSAIPSALLNRPVPVFELPPIQGFNEGLSTDTLKGRVSMINIFASWCVGCAIEHPVLVDIAVQGDILITGINWKDKPGDGTAWLKRHGNPYAFIGDDTDGRVAIDFGITGAPETFIVDKKGVIRYKQVGPITADIWKYDLKPIIERLKNE